MDSLTHFTVKVKRLDNPIFNYLVHKVAKSSDHPWPERWARAYVIHLRFECANMGGMEGFEYFQRATGILSLKDYNTFMS